jgi:hypothetical protein
VDHDDRTGNALADAARGRQDMPQVGAAVLIGRRADRNENHIGMRNRAVVVGAELDAAGCGVGGNQLVQARLMDRDLPGVEHIDLARIDIQAQHGIADVSEAGSRNQANITGTDNRNFHKRI